MAAALDLKSLEQAFQGRADLQGAIKSAASTYILSRVCFIPLQVKCCWNKLGCLQLTCDIGYAPAYNELFNQISLHINSLTSSFTTEPASKKRRLDEAVPSRPAANGTTGNAAAKGISAPASSSDPVLLEVKEISVVIPQRKKYTLCFTSTHLYARLPDSTEPAPGISYAWKDIGMPHPIIPLLALNQLIT